MRKKAEEAGGVRRTTEDAGERLNRPDKDGLGSAPNANRSKEHLVFRRAPSDQEHAE